MITDGSLEIPDPPASGRASHRMAPVPADATEAAAMTVPIGATP